MDGAPLQLTEANLLLLSLSTSDRRYFITGENPSSFASGNAPSCMREMTPTSLRFPTPTSSMREPHSPLFERETTPPFTPSSVRYTTPLSVEENTPSYMSDATGSTLTKISQYATGTALSVLEKIPGEIRNQIYEYLLSAEYATIVENDTDGYSVESMLETRSYKYNTNMFQVNRKIGQECQEFFHHKNRFVRISTNSETVLACAMRNVPVVIPQDADNFSAQFLDVTIHVTSPSYLGQIAKHDQIVLAGKDVPTFIDHLRITDLDWAREHGERLQPLLRVYLSLQTRPKTGAENGNMLDVERAVLTPFKELVRVADCQITGEMDFWFAQEVAHNMMRWLPIGPDIISFCEKIRTQSKTAGEDVDLPELNNQYVRALNLFGQALESRDNARLVGGPETVMKLLVLTVEYLTELSFVSSKREDFDMAAQYIQYGIEFVEHEIPDCPPRYKAQLHLQLAFVHIRKVYQNEIGQRIDQIFHDGRLQCAVENVIKADELITDRADFTVLIREVYLAVYGTLLGGVVAAVSNVLSS